MDENRLKQIKQLVELTNQASDKQSQFFQHILIVSVSMLAILVSLRGNVPQSLCILAVFALAVVLLSLGILLIARTLYDYSMLSERTRKAFHAELDKSLEKDRDPELITIKHLERTSICQKYGLISLLSSLFMLVIYSLLTLFL